MGKIVMYLLDTNILIYHFNISVISKIEFLKELEKYEVSMINIDLEELTSGVENG